MPTRNFVLGQLSFMTRNKISWRDATDDFVTGWLYSYDNDVRMEEIQGAPV